MAQSHLAMTTDGVGNIFAVSGQLGNQCRPATPAGFALEVRTRQWTRLPDLPVARYAATMQLWNGRLHLVGGSHEDRHTPAVEHWSLAVADGRATENSWRTEVPIPRGGPHRASAILCGQLYVFGGQEGDYIPIPGNPDYVCTGDLVDEWHHPEVHVLAPGARAWRRAADMPVAVSHTEFSTLQEGNRLVLFGGQHAKDRDARVLKLTDAIQCYDAERDAWKVVGTLPYRVKTNVIGRHDGWIYSALGQRDRGPGDAAAGEIVAHTWRARMPAGWLA
jgi:N-acetylneuraminic acid mutarotase